MIHFHTEDTSFKFKSSASLKGWIKQVISDANMDPGDINYIFCSDEYLHKINLEYLHHDTYTDIITFNYCIGKVVSSDIYISVDRVRENATEFDTSFENELHRVMVHGILHLVGYNDKTDVEQEEMRAKEDFYLSLLLV
ncbi:MAG: rRNA maturation RNase YbeY [Flavobacteriales bacterium]|nr:rRNA maturation RNase YbeY [Flavobacteriales bacterium]